MSNNSKWCRQNWTNFRSHKFLNQNKLWGRKTLVISWSRHDRRLSQWSGLQKDDTSPWHDLQSDMNDSYKNIGTSSLHSQNWGNLFPSNLQVLTIGNLCRLSRSLLNKRSLWNYTCCEGLFNTEVSRPAQNRTSESWLILKFLTEKTRDSLSMWKDTFGRLSYFQILRSPLAHN